MSSTHRKRGALPSTDWLGLGRWRSHIYVCKLDMDTDMDMDMDMDKDEAALPPRTGGAYVST